MTTGSSRRWVVWNSLFVFTDKKTFGLSFRVIIYRRYRRWSWRCCSTWPIIRRNNIEPHFIYEINLNPLHIQTPMTFHDKLAAHSHIHRLQWDSIDLSAPTSTPSTPSGIPEGLKQMLPLSIIFYADFVQITVWREHHQRWRVSPVSKFSCSQSFVLKLMEHEMVVFMPQARTYDNISDRNGRELAVVLRVCVCEWVWTTFFNLNCWSTVIIYYTCLNYFLFVILMDYLTWCHLSVCSASIILHAINLPQMPE